MVTIQESSAKLLAAVFALAAVTLGAQAPTQPAPARPQSAAERMQMLPAPLREQARLALAEPDEAKRGKLVEALIRANPAATLDFALALLEEEASPVVRTEIFDELK